MTRPPGHAKRHGPPPHAPAHGYRHKHSRDGVELVYDAGVEVYVVTGHEAVYWDGDRYVRWVDGHWQAAVRLDGVWISIGNDELPRRLVARHEVRHKKAGKHKRGRGHGPPARRAD